MSRFYIEPEAVAGTSARVYSAGEKFLTEAGKIRSIKGDIGSIMTEYPALMESLESSAEYADKIGRKTMDFGTAAFEAAKIYQGAEDTLTGKQPPAWASGPIGHATPPTNIPDIFGNWDTDWYKHIGTGGLWPIYERENWTSTIPTVGLVGLVDAFKKLPHGTKSDVFLGGGRGLSKHNMVSGWSKEGLNGEKQPWDAKKLKEESKVSADPMFKIAGAEFQTSALHGDKKFGEDDDLVHGEIHGDVLKFEANAEAYASPRGMGVGAGAALTAFSAGGSMQIGNDTLGMHGEATVSAGKFAAQGSAQIGFDKDGNFNCGAEGSLEAILGEVSVKGGYDVLGTDIDVTGSLNFGVGVHGKIGLNDGKFQIDVGASLGVGASLSLEIDVSDTIKNAEKYAGVVSDAAQSAWSFLSDTADDALNWLGW